MWVNVYIIEQLKIVYDKTGANSLQAFEFWKELSN